MPIHRATLCAIALIVVSLQFDIWAGNVSLPVLWDMAKKIEAQEIDNVKLENISAHLSQDIASLKSRGNAIEAHARMDLGMIRPGEIFYYADEAP